MSTNRGFLDAMQGSMKTLDEVVRVLDLEGRAIQDCASRLRDDADASASIDRALRLFQDSLAKGGKIIVTGVGKSGKIAQKISATLCSTGSFAIFLHPTEGLHGDLGLINPKDVVLALSYSGNTEELVRLLPSIRSLRVPIVAMGGRKDSQLARKCDVWIDAAVAHEACPHNLAPTCSTTLALALGDALAVALMQLRGFDAGAFARNHPGGTLGQRLHLKVADSMHTGDAVPTVSEDATIDEVLVLSTRKKLGAVLVTKGSQLQGIITDGDIRRALQYREKFFSMKAAEVMTRSPVTIPEDSFAIQALELMENRPSQISVLPVVRAGTNEWVGLIRLHDLLRSL